MSIDLNEKYQTIIKAILTPYLKQQYVYVYVFGSRAKGTAKTYSDVDLCLEGELLSFTEMASLKEAFSESDLPYFVDVLQQKEISKPFYLSIKDSFVALI